MSVVAEFQVRSPDLPMEQALESVPAMEIELVTEVGTDPDRPYLFFWARGDDFQAFDAALAADPTVAEVQVYTEFEEEVLYRLRVTAETEVVSYPVLLELGADRLQTVHLDGWWHVRMRFPNRSALSDLHGWYRDRGVEFDLERIYTDPGHDGASNLTDPQREVLQVALRLGYFEVPRQSSMDEVAEELGISEQAVSERLRRGHKKLVARHLLPAGGP